MFRPLKQDTLLVFFERLGNLVAYHWRPVLLIWVLVVAGVHLAAPRWDDVTHDGDFAYLPDEMTSVRGAKLLEAAFPDFFSKSQVALVFAREKGRLTGPDLKVADQLLAAFPPNDNGDSYAVSESDSDDPGPSAPIDPGEPSPPAESSGPAAKPAVADDTVAAEQPRPSVETNRDEANKAPIDPDNPITAVWSYDTPVIGKKLITEPSGAGQAALVVFHLRNEFMAIDNMALLRRIYQKLDELRRAPDFPKGLKLGVTGSAAIGSDMLFSAEQSIRNTELTTIALVVLILLVVYRAPGLVLVPLVTIGASVWLAMDLVALAAQASDWLPWFDFKIFKTTRIFVIVILFGAGTDFCLFLIARYKEELQLGLSCPEAVAEALAQVGSALAASALTTVFGLGMMFFADFGKFSNSGPAIAMCLVVALVACITLAPALLRAAGQVVFWPFGVGAGTVHDGKDQARLGPTSRWTGSLWERISRAIIARPGLILVGSLLLLLPMTRPARVLTKNLLSGNVAGAEWQFSAPVTYNLLAELSPDQPSVQGTHLLWRYFPADQTGPLTVLIYQPGTNFDSKQGRHKIARLTKELFNFEYHDASGKPVCPIVSVRSLTEPMGDVPGGFNPLSAAGRRKLVTMHHPRTLAAFVGQSSPAAGQVTRFDLISRYAPFSKESVDLLNQVETMLLAKTVTADSPWHGAEVDFVGTTAGIRDLEAVTASDRLRIQLLVMLAVLAVLIVILRRPLICIYLILSVLLGYYVTIGTTELLFSWIYGDAFTGLDWKVPIFLFVILIAVGQDYNIYLATRVFEEQRQRGPTEGLRVAVVRTGGIITSCGVIMAGTFASMTSGTLHTMQQLGFALSLGVLLDTFVIRTILVPSFLAILARREEKRGSSPPETAAPQPCEPSETVLV
ncbi:MAG: MMPL family transporter [Pirellulales bacterium]|nr:MMPL family transporter [Pirellulales bacterium]